MTSLNGRTAVITGASSGIGAATAELLAANGAAVALLARRKDRLDALAAKITAAGGTALAVPVDITDAADLEAKAALIENELGPAGIVFANAGIMLPAPIEELAVDQWRHQIDLNVTAKLSTIGAFVPQLVRAAARDGVADLVNTSSIAAQNIFVNFAVYSATKAFVTHLSRHMRAELGQKGVRVSAVEPGITTTELQGHVTDPGAVAWLAGVRESMELLTPEDIARTVAFVVSQPRHVNLQQVTVMPTQEVM
ncbi:oxidoreductase [Virgisporangium aliadipatigenens]|uniref:Oxidoreductase n=1 Tax=Virgisporangium aliadipatigenens TaxID=741659 RepID=A0A8J3YRC1_9ACTN|nr:SDR family oxidoreductase [Virgisporangium aliadipatigenens]GIJ50249.1 oxidoreductase [Virgisporangium aliadipatigenens]